MKLEFESRRVAMDPQKFKTQMGDLAMGTALNAAARDYQKVCGAHIVTFITLVEWDREFYILECRRRGRHDVIIVAEAHEVSGKQFRVSAVHRSKIYIDLVNATFYCQILEV